MTDQRPATLLDERTRSVGRLVFYRTFAMPCPYLPGRVERRVVAELTPSLAFDGLFDDLTAAGFRRSHAMVYRPACAGCDACVPVRIPAASFQPSRTQRRLAQLNADLTVSVAPASATLEQFALFHAYQHGRHAESDMALMDWGDYRAMVEDGAYAARLLQLRDPGGQLVACCLFDALAAGCSAVYSFYDPDAPRRSLGTELILRLIALAQAEGLPHVYLGYMIEACRKMAYKGRFKPLERLTAAGWRADDGSSAA